MENIVKEVLTPVLADEYVLYTKLHNYHWNIVGPQFFGVHRLLEEQYNELQPLFDEIAEVIRSYRHNAIGTLKEFSDNTRLNEHPNEYPNETQMIQNLVSDHEKMASNLKVDLKKISENGEYPDIEDMLTSTIEKHVKMAWLLRSIIKK